VVLSVDGVLFLLLLVRSLAPSYGRRRGGSDTASR
jgi:hypothetical protein